MSRDNREKDTDETWPDAYAVPDPTSATLDDDGSTAGDDPVEPIEDGGIPRTAGDDPVEPV
jgi:hypothetical protein